MPGGAAASAAATRPSLRAAPATAGIRLDGRLDEAVWATADSISDLVQIEPVQGGVPSGRTVVRVLVNAHELIIGVRADAPRSGALAA